jgi:hypothetical protein
MPPDHPSLESGQDEELAAFNAGINMRHQKGTVVTNNNALYVLM